MLFNSLHFLSFFPIVVLVYFLLPRRVRWAWLLGASYYFYAAWRVEYLGLILISTLTDYTVGRRMGSIAEQRRRTPYLLISLVVNLGILFTFKYFNFFNDSTRSLFALFDLDYRLTNLDVLLPVGISFYTFQTLSYTIDIWRGRLEPERHLGRFALYIAFFPQLVAGPIERASRLLPQFRSAFTDAPARFDSARVTSGLRADAVGHVYEGRHRGQARALRQPSLQQPQRLRRPARALGDLLLRLPNFLRFRGLLEHRHRRGAGNGL